MVATRDNQSNPEVIILPICNSSCWAQSLRLDERFRPLSNCEQEAAAYAFFKRTFAKPVGSHDRSDKFEQLISGVDAGDDSVIRRQQLSSVGTHPGGPVKSWKDKFCVIGNLKEFLSEDIGVGRSSILQLQSHPWAILSDTNSPNFFNPRKPSSESSQSDQLCSHGAAVKAYTPVARQTGHLVHRQHSVSLRSLFCYSLPQLSGERRTKDIALNAAGNKREFDLA